MISNDIEYVLNEPANKTKIPVLVFSLSATVTHDRIQKALGKIQVYGKSQYVVHLTMIS